MYGSFSEGKKAIDLAVGFNSFKAGEHTWHMKKMDIFNHPKFYGAPGYTYKGMAISCPLDMQKSGNADGGSSNIPSIGMRYKALGDYSRQMKVWGTGGAKNVTNTFDVDQLNMRTEMGSEYIASNRFFLMSQL